MGKIAKVQEVTLDKLIPYVNNAKIHSEDQITKIASSIREFGFLSPVLIDAKYNIIAGHGRAMAAKKLALESVPCVFIEGLSEAQRKAYILADNPNMSSKEAFALTKKMMTGHKWECFVLNLSFLGWVFLSLCTCGILAIFYVEPYKAYTMAGFYKVRAQQMKYLNAPIDGYNQ